VNNGTLVNFPSSPWTIGHKGTTASLAYVFIPRRTLISIR
jgi:hypothetical protein